MEVAFNSFEILGRMPGLEEQKCTTQGFFLKYHESHSITKDSGREVEMAALPLDDFRVTVMVD